MSRYRENEALHPLEAKRSGSVTFKSKMQVILIGKMHTQSLSTACTASTKLGTFYYKFLHRRIATNDFFKENKFKAIGQMLLLPKENKRLYLIYF